MDRHSLLGIRKDASRCGSLYTLNGELLGQSLAKYLGDIENLNLLQTRIDNLRWVYFDEKPDHASKKRYTSLGYHFDSHNFSYPEKTENWGELLLAMQEVIWFPNVLHGALDHMVNAMDLFDDALWAYFVDFV
jgi:hypothetical protein